MDNVTLVDFLSLLVALLALVAAVVAVGITMRQARLAQQANAIPALVDMFSEHRGRHLSDAREYVYRELPPGTDLSQGLDSIPDPEIRRKVLDLMWFYDNLGVLVVHGVVDPKPVSGYLGGAAKLMWRNLEPLILVERQKRANSPDFNDPGRWQHYFELLLKQVDRNPPHSSRDVFRRDRFERVIP